MQNGRHGVMASHRSNVDRLTAFGTEDVSHLISIAGRSFGCAGLASAWDQQPYPLVSLDDNGYHRRINVTHPVALVYHPA